MKPSDEVTFTWRGSQDADDLSGWAEYSFQGLDRLSFSVVLPSLRAALTLHDFIVAACKNAAEFDRAAFRKRIVDAAMSYDASNATTTGPLATSALDGK